MSYEILTNFSQFSYTPLTKGSYPYFKLLTNFIWTSFKLTSYELVTNCYVLLSFRAACKHLMRFLWTSFNLLTRLSQMFLILILNCSETLLELLNFLQNSHKVHLDLLYISNKLPLTFKMIAKTCYSILINSWQSSNMVLTKFSFYYLKLHLNFFLTLYKLL